MRAVLRLLGLVVAAFFIVVFSTATFFFIKAFWFSGAKPHASRTAKSGYVAVLDVSGTLFSATRSLKLLEEILDDPRAKALVVRINSPGGLVAPSQELYEAFKRADQKIPVVVSMGAVAASGGYYAALGGRHIYANPGTLTGSVGVIMEFVNAQKLYEWAKLDRYALYAGKLKAAGNEFRPMTAEEREVITSLLEDVHSQFKAAVKERRKLSTEEIERWCDGRILTGSQAKKVRFVDSLGPLEDALKEARTLAHLPDNAEVIYVDKDDGVLRQLLWGDKDNGPSSSISESLRVLHDYLALSASPPGWRVMLLSGVRP